MSAPILGAIRPSPTDEEAAAIAIAMELLWPRPSPISDTTSRSNWRFSGRWWDESSNWASRAY
ncbi:MAG: hypothetical protein VX685_03450 [Actinomycetota bacterium]|nr:hypothetical protein [Acidimicrobiales bacterium]MEC8922600.1 hypothetical protein [Actinomycetota bacterium]MEC8975106.1 hypothetical protein [Actinomycetota bacterium]MED6304079.1 hypothetical protein [Actinomycetota bacterium]